MSIQAWRAGVLALGLVWWGLSLGATSVADEPKSQDPFGGGFGGEATSETPYSPPFSKNLVPSGPLRVWCDSDPSATEALYSKLQSERVGSLEFAEGTPLEEVVALINQEYGLDVQIDHTALDELGLGVDEPISVNVRDVKLGAALRLMLEPLEMTYTILDGIVRLTTEENSRYHPSIAIYPVADLLLEGGYDPLIESIKVTVVAETWADNGGGLAEIRPYPQRGALVIVQTTDAHEQIAAFLASLRSLPVDPHAKPYRPATQKGRKAGGAGRTNSAESRGGEANPQRSRGGRGGFGGGEFGGGRGGDGEFGGGFGGDF